MTDKVHHAIQLQIAKDSGNKIQNINKNISHYELSQTMSGTGEADVACPSINVSASLFDVDDTWIFDIGCGHDLVSSSKTKFLEDAYCVAKKQRFNTANGEFETSKAVHLDLDLLGDVFSAMPYIMANTPSVISVGKKVMQEEFCSIWIVIPLTFCI